MKVAVIGGTGHVGTYLVPRLVEAGHEVVVVSRRSRAPYLPNRAWQQVTAVEIDRDAGERDGTFAARVCALAPDAVIDLIAFAPASTAALVEALRGRVRHFLHCGTIWVKGPLALAPTREEDPSPPVGAYGMAKARIEELLLSEARRGRFPATLINPGHIVGPGHPPVNPVGNKSWDVFARLARGEPLAIPNFGMETLHHVHADDVARLFVTAMERWSASVGEAFFAVSPAAVTVRGFAQEAARWFGREAELRPMPWAEWTRACGLSDADVEASREHLEHSQCCSPDKARRLLGFEPRFGSYEAVRESVDWAVERGELRVGRGAFPNAVT